MTYKKEKFDGLAKNYDIYRPRYPNFFFQQIDNLLEKKNNINILDIGAGSGIALEGITKIINKKNNFYAIDISKDMIKIGKKKFSYINWIHGKAEEKISEINNLDLVIFAQSFQWMNKIKLLKIIKKKLNKKGIICIIQNNRNFSINKFLFKYENLIETVNKNYSRNYRNLNYKNELKLVFPKYIYIYISFPWNTFLSKKEFIKMSNTSTQIQETKKINNIMFKKKLKNIINKYIINKKLKIDFTSELFIIKKLI